MKQAICMQQKMNWHDKSIVWVWYSWKPSFSSAFCDKLWRTCSLHGIQVSYLRHGIPPWHNPHMTNIYFQWSLCRRHPHQSPSGLQRVFSKRLRLLIGNCKHWKRNSGSSFRCFLWSVHISACAFETFHLNFAKLDKWLFFAYHKTNFSIILILNFRGFEEWSELRHCFLHLRLCPDPYHVSLGTWGISEEERNFKRGIADITIHSPRQWISDRALKVEVPMPPYVLQSSKYKPLF